MLTNKSPPSNTSPDSSLGVKLCIPPPSTPKTVTEEQEKSLSYSQDPKQKEACLKGPPQDHWGFVAHSCRYLIFYYFNLNFRKRKGEIPKKLKKMEKKKKKMKISGGHGK